MQPVEVPDTKNDAAAPVGDPEAGRAPTIRAPAAEPDAVADAGSDSSR